MCLLWVGFVLVVDWFWFGVVLIWVINVELRLLMLLLFCWLFIGVDWIDFFIFWLVRVLLRLIRVFCFFGCGLVCDGICWLYWCLGRRENGGGVE